MWTDLIFNVFPLAIAAADATSCFFVLSVSNCGDPRQLVLRHLTNNDRLHGRGRREPAFAFRAGTSGRTNSLRKMCWANISFHERFLHLG
ncbi:hypothetical protein QEZ47_11385 [Aminobacter anthyllidis]|uniref:hypothetical protein n=1 Tax=Aminobacter anthyllidis TaxID=1035067 RepID=UPI0024588C1D|nr:hypothetical protein [Aminobacter anthyllidis]MDH4986128.1 hypothetical protein [Aminobacter anthyllidis]